MDLDFYFYNENDKRCVQGMERRRADQSAVIVIKSMLKLSILKIPKPTFLVERGDIIGDPRPGAVEVLPLLPRQLGTLPPC